MQDPPPPPPIPESIISSAYRNTAATRVAFDNRSDTSLPLNFSFVSYAENSNLIQQQQQQQRRPEIAGCALPTSKEQVRNMSARFGIALVISAIEVEVAPPAHFFSSQLVLPASTSSLLSSLSFESKSRDEDAEAEVKLPGHIVLPTPNYGTPRVEQLEAAIEVARTVVEEHRRPVVVHCFAGKGRTGLFLACYLVHGQKRFFFAFSFFSF